MTTRAITVLLNAITGPYEAAMGRASASTARFGATAQGAQARAGGFGGALAGVGSKLFAGGGLIYGLTESAQLLMSYEDALVGVGKTTGLTGDDLSALGDELTDLSTQIRGSAEDMLAIGQSAAQLGVANEDIAEFTEVIANMASATDLSTDAAATGMARLSNILGRPISEVEALGSSFVALGNTMATTEPEILNMAMRLGAAGRTAGLADSDVVGLAAAMSALGIEAEAGGTAMSRVLNEVTKAVGTGSEELTLFAETARMSSEQFAEAWEANPAAALTAFLEGLSQLSEGERFRVMDELGLDAARLTDVLLRTSAGADTLAGAFTRSEEAMRENVALAEEAAVANQTLSTAVENLGDKIKQMTRDFLGNEQGAAFAASGINAVTMSVEDLAATQVLLNQPLARMKRVVDNLAIGFGLLPAPMSDAEQAQSDLNVTLRDAYAASAAAMAGTDDYTTSTADLGDELMSTEEKQRALADAMLAATDPAFAYVDAQNQARDAAQSYADALEDPEASAEDVEEALLDMLEAQLRVDAAALESGTAFNSLISNIGRLEAAGRLTTAEADRMRQAIADARAEAERFAGNYMARLRLDIQAVNVSSNERVLLGQIGYRADGGPVSAGQPYVVGEEGPELFWPDTAGTIIPAGQTSQMAGMSPQAAGGTTIVNHYTVHAPNYLGTEADLLNGVKRVLAKDAKRGGTLIANVVSQ